MGGPEAVRIMRVEYGYTGLIVGATGNSLPQDIAEFAQAGVQRVMTKPLDMNEFIAYTKGKLLLYNFI